MYDQIGEDSSQFLRQFKNCGVGQLGGSNRNLTFSVVPFQGPQGFSNLIDKKAYHTYSIFQLSITLVIFRRGDLLVSKDKPFIGSMDEAAPQLFLQPVLVKADGEGYVVGGPKPEGMRIELEELLQDYQEERCQ